MNILIRADASLQIGTGHVMRCLTLADALRLGGCGVSFISRECPGSLCDWLEEKGYAVKRISEPAEGEIEAAARILSEADKPVDWLVTDHYGLDARWEEAMRGLVRRMMVIDDLANRPHDCDVLLNQNLLHPAMARRYEQLTPARCIRLLGPEYALLRQQFTAERRNSRYRTRDGRIGRILLFFGGTDWTNETAKALQAVRPLLDARPGVNVDVVVGQANPHREHIYGLCRAMPGATCHTQLDNMAECMAQADLFLGAAGSTTWERWCMRLPGILIAVAGNQIATAQMAQSAGVDMYLGMSEDVTPEAIALALDRAFHHPDALLNAGAIAGEYVDGQGAARVAAVLRR
ncbi:UDP-2,4-diacetamido-2,4,6-trideoxy-beta-L-altropyranose hydrolase [Paenibacillus sp. y28]|uniref:UDP-2,4-diacetamido-2,4, 6-trideoxy-beta-L-altropyranose hydrolase n=1 Tax=Paenibacillus sp. y28 TaxID=3129110 RepID=UPI003018D87A